MLHASSDQSGAHISIKLGYLDLIQIAVDPVEFSSDPVHGQALRGGQTVLHDHFNSCHPWNNNTNNTDMNSSRKECQPGGGCYGSAQRNEATPPKHRKKVWCIISCSRAVLFFHRETGDQFLRRDCISPGCTGMSEYMRTVEEKIQCHHRHLHLLRLPFQLLLYI